MELNDCPKDIRRFLLEHWTKSELDSQMRDPEYFIDQVVIPRLEYLKRLGEDVPRVRLLKTPAGGFRLLLT